MPKELKEGIKIQGKPGHRHPQGRHPDDPPEGVNCPCGTGGEGEGLGVHVTKDRWRRGRTGITRELREHNRTQSPPALTS